MPSFYLSGQHQTQQLLSTRSSVYLCFGTCRAEAGAAGTLAWSLPARSLWRLVHVQRRRDSDILFATFSISSFGGVIVGVYRYSCDVILRDVLGKGWG